MPDENVPPNVRKRLAVELKTLRGDRKQEDVVRALLAIPGSGRWSVSKLSKIENNQARIQPDEVEDLLTVLGVEDGEMRARLKLWAKVARRKGRWHQRGRHLPDNVRDLMDYEDRATVLRIWEPLLIPAACQHPRWTEQVVLGLEPSITNEELARRVEARAERAIVPGREEPQEWWILLDERVLRGRVRSLDVQIEQLRYLIELAALDNVTLQVVPIDVGPHPGLAGWFTLLEFADDSPDIAYTDGIYGSLYLEDAEDVRRCTLVFGHLLGIALNPTDSIALINRVIEQLSQELQ
ncbi:DUF5753 domain-containing protein [Saccharothrix sp. NPDC042600]|uniref:DUF5753 domain-containing protein n=1 Tax=Saccharothrix TaxID=2071 RepID=UPI0033CCCFBC|nr:helix-turn-helix transcriptional regulator [Saccharothrix mutabilis subsp. capreolus]